MNFYPFIPAPAFVRSLRPGSVNILSPAIDISMHDLRILLAEKDPPLNAKTLEDIVECRETVDYPKGGLSLNFGVETHSRKVLLFADPVVFSARQSNIGPIKSVVLYDKDIDRVMGWWNYSHPITLLCWPGPETFTIVFNDEDNAVVWFDYSDIPSAF